MTITKERHRERSLSELPVRFREIAAGGADFTNYGYHTKFQARKALLLSARNHGWTYKDCWRAFLSDPAMPTWELWGSGRGEIGPDGRMKRLREDYRQIEAYAAENPSAHNEAEARARIGELKARAAGWSWRGQGGRTDRDVLAVAHEFGTERGSVTVLMPTRTVAIKAGISERTVSSSLARNVRAGWLRKGEKYRNTRRYTLTQPCQAAGNDDNEVDTDYTYYSQVPSGSMCKVYPPSAEIWVMLGKSARHVWLALSGNPHSSRELAKLAGTCHRTAGKAAKRLAEFGLAVHVEKQGWTRGTADPDTVAAEQGFDIAAKRAKRYEADRAAHDEWAQNRDAASGNRAYRKSHEAIPPKPKLRPVATPAAVPSKGIDWEDEFVPTGPWADVAA